MIYSLEPVTNCDQFIGLITICDRFLAFAILTLYSFTPLIRDIVVP